MQFNRANGAIPYSDLIADSSGNLYGTTSEGGAFDNGTVFKVANDATHTLTTLASFSGANGDFPYAGVVADSTGNVYGTTERGGASNGGTVFKLEAGTNALTTLASFDISTGFSVRDQLAADAAGNLFGTTTFNGPGPGSGTVFELTSDTQSLNIFPFDGPNGGNPEAGPTIGPDGRIYGTAYAGGAYSYGTVYELVPVPEPSNLVLTAIAVALFWPAAGFRLSAALGQPDQCRSSPASTAA